MNMNLDPALLEIIVCPACRADLDVVRVVSASQDPVGPDPVLGPDALELVEHHLPGVEVADGVADLEACRHALTVAPAMPAGHPRSWGSSWGAGQP